MSGTAAMSGDGAFIAFCDLTKTFPQDRGGDISVVEPLSLTIGEGEFVVFVGPSGCGKTTVMRMVGGLEIPTTGEVLLAGRRVEGPSREKGMVFQSYSSFPWLTVLGNIRFGLKYRRDVAPDEADRIARRYLDLVGLTPFADFYVNRISGGMRQRVAIARTLAADPLVLLMDEPFGALDALTRERLQLQLLELRRAERKTVIFVTHDVDEAVFLADRIVVFSARPARVLRDIKVSAALPAERALEVMELPAFRQLRREVLALIRDEEMGVEAAALSAAS
jgi:NitT/TauT family transport system ATP-binding protein